MRTYNEVQTGDVDVDATITFKGSIRATLYDMSIAEWIQEMLDAGDYEFEVVNGNVEITNVETDFEELD